MLFEERCDRLKRANACRSSFPLGEEDLSGSLFQILLQCGLVFFFFVAIHLMYSLQEGAFDEAVKGIVAIEHTASPVTPPSDDPEGM